MNAAARAALMRRGLDDLFHPGLRRSIGELIDDVQARGDSAVSDALSKFDGIEVTPPDLRVSERELDEASVSIEVDA